MITQLTFDLLILTIILGFIGGLFDNSFGMGYGLLTPIFFSLGFSLLVIVPTLLLSQAITGFSGAIFHLLFKNVDFKTVKSKESKVAILFTFTGILGIIFALLFIISFPVIVMNLYLGLMMISVGLIVLFNLSLVDSWKRLYFIAAIAGFNKAISGGGYGTLVTSGQLMTGSKVRNSIGATQLSEAILSILSYILYISSLIDFSETILTIQLSLIMIISGVAASPIGALIAKKLKEETARKVVGILSVSLGAISLIRIFTIGIF
jgi:uncharacterized protein